MAANVPASAGGDQAYLIRQLHFPVWPGFQYRSGHQGKSPTVASPPNVLAVSEWSGQRFDFRVLRQRPVE